MVASKKYRMNWYDYYVNMLPAVAAKSKDIHTKVGAIIVGPEHEIRSTGYNGYRAGQMTAN